MKFDSLEGGTDGEHTGIGFVEISKTAGMQGEFFFVTEAIDSFGREHVGEHSMARHVTHMSTLEAPVTCVTSKKGPEPVRSNLGLCNNVMPRESCCELILQLEMVHLR